MNLEALRVYWESLSERERRLVQILGAVMVVILISLPLYLLSSSISVLKEENDEIASLIAEINRSEERLARSRAERAAAERLYERAAPPLGTLVERLAGARGMTIASVNNQPEHQEGRYRRRHLRATFRGVDLRQVVRLMVDLENQPYPIAIERIHLDHSVGGGDQYNLELGVITFDRSTASAESDS